jgi:hypothetical protein
MTDSIIWRKGLDGPLLPTASRNFFKPRKSFATPVQNSASNACIPEVELRRLDQAPAQAERTGEFGQIEQLRGLDRGQRHEPRQDPDLPDVGEVFDVRWALVLAPDWSASK